MNPPLDTHQPHQGAPRIGYVLKVYPRFSETFIVTEILAREAHGDDLRIYALRPTTDARFHPEIARVRAQVSWVPRPSKASDFWAQLSNSLRQLGGATEPGHRPVEPAHRGSDLPGGPRALRRHHAGPGRAAR